MKIPQDAHIDNVFFCQNLVENRTQIFLRFDVNRDKSDVMTSFGMIVWSGVFCVIMLAGSSLFTKYNSETPPGTTYFTPVSVPCWDIHINKRVSQCILSLNHSLKNHILFVILRAPQLTSLPQNH
jgi:hypothetical protein